MNRAPIAEPSPQFEAVWADLRTQLEWSSGFALIFIFASHHTQVDALRQRVRDSLASRSLQLHASAADVPEGLVDAMLGAILAACTSPDGGPQWIEVWRDSPNPAMNRARGNLLARLNERRGALEAQLKAPLILVLPVDFRPQVRDLAPDLWHVRAFSAEIEASKIPGAAALSQGDGQVAKSATAREKLPTPDPLEMSVEARRVVDAWAQLAAIGDPDRLDINLGLEAFDRYLLAHRLSDARAVLDAVERVARRRYARASGTAAVPAALRALGMVLDRVGDLAMAEQRLPGAAEAYEESLAISRKLLTQLGETPQVLRDLSVSLNNVGRVAFDLGQGEAARTAYEESLAIFRKLLVQLGETPQSLRDLSVSLDNVGRVARDLGQGEAARTAYEESLAIRRKLLAQLGETPQGLRDLSISLDSVGEVARDLGQGEAARTAYDESLAIRRNLLAQLGDTPQGLRDLSTSLDNVGAMLRDLGQPKESDAALEEANSVRAKLDAILLSNNRRITNN